MPKMKAKKLKSKGYKRDGSEWDGETCIVDGKAYGVKLVLIENFNRHKVYAVRHIEVNKTGEGSNNGNTAI